MVVTGPEIIAGYLIFTKKEHYDRNMRLYTCKT